MSWIVNKDEKGFAEIRKKAKSALASMEFPGLKDEDWKYTKLGKISKKSFTVENIKKSKAVNEKFFSEASVRFVFENGFFREGLSKGSSPYIKRISDLTEQQLTSALAETGYVKEGIIPSYNDAFFTDGVYINIPAGTTVEGVIELVYISNGNAQASVVKNIILAGEKSNAELVFNFTSENATENLVNHVFHAAVHAGAKLTLYKIQDEITGVSHFSSENIFQKNNSVFEIHTITLNGDLVRNDLNIKVDGTGCHTHLGGVFVATNHMHVDNHTIVDHQKPDCTSDEIYKGIAGDKATGVFNGKIFVRRNAQKINAYQNSANVLLSDDASIYTKPELEIYADDVKCSHGTTTGCLDEAALFYLRARGIGEENARNLLIHAFANDMIEKIANDGVRNWILEKMDAKLERDLKPIA
ncbi:MAG TPA: Fe-S cluster assembly protein SufD [Flavobacteriales bacterium]|nr:Fe-S cluster assembly protein SufD [Flavobacteriales bacterium]